MSKDIFVLSVLHDLHAKYESYTYWHLQKILAAYDPDLICMEVGPRRLAAGDFRVYSPER